MLPNEAGPNGAGGFTDLEQRYRNRPLDFIMKPSSRSVIRARHAMNTFIRSFFHERGYVGVETLILSQQAGGASAKPFVTYYNDLKRDNYLLIAPELYLKQFIVGGERRVYELGKVFRNEDIDLTHNPEFTSVEFFQTDADYETMIKLKEEMISSLVYELNDKSYTTQYMSQTGRRWISTGERPGSASI
jgi:lysyl-tRNA synthetase class 2